MNLIRSTTVDGWESKSSLQHSERKALLIYTYPNASATSRLQSDILLCLEFHISFHILLLRRLISPLRQTQWTSKHPVFYVLPECNQSASCLIARISPALRKWESTTKASQPIGPKCQQYVPMHLWHRTLYASATMSWPRIQSRLRSWAPTAHTAQSL